VDHEAVARRKILEAVGADRVGLLQIGAGAVEAALRHGVYVPDADQTRFDDLATLLLDDTER